jgi:hypothetical protein
MASMLGERCWLITCYQPLHAARSSNNRDLRRPAQNKPALTPYHAAPASHGYGKIKNNNKRLLQHVQLSSI